jgi:hypothetical protein
MLSVVFLPLRNKLIFKNPIFLRHYISFLIIFSFKEKRKEMSCGRLNASWKISSSAVDGQSFLVIDGSLLNKNKRKDWFLKNHESLFFNNFYFERHKPSIRIQE